MSLVDCAVNVLDCVVHRDEYVDPVDKWTRQLNEGKTEIYSHDMWETHTQIVLCASLMLTTCVRCLFWW